MTNIQRNLRLLALFNFCVDFRPYAPLAILYFSQVAGSFAGGMSVFSVIMLSTALAEVPTGIFSDYLGRKRTLIAGSVCSVLFLLCYALGGSIGMLWLGAALEGFSRAFWSGNNDALLYDTLAEMDETANFADYSGRIGSMFQWALALSALLGSGLALISLSAVMWVSVLPQIGTVFFALQIINPRRVQATPPSVYSHLREAFRNLWHNTRLRTLTAASILQFALGESAFQFRATFFEMLLPVWLIGIMRTLANLGAALSFYFAGSIIRRVGELNLLVSSIVFCSVLIIAGLLFPSPLSPLVMAATSVFFGVNMTASGALRQREFTDEQRATMGSIGSFASSLAFAVFALLLGAWADRFGVINTLLIVEVISLVVPYLYWRVFRRHSAASSYPIPTSVSAVDG